MKIEWECGYLGVRHQPARRKESIS